MASSSTMAFEKPSIHTSRKTMQCEKMWGMSIKSCEKGLLIEFGLRLGDFGKYSRKQGFSLH